MLSVEADILAFDLDSLRLLRGYREAGLNARAERAKVAADVEAAEDQQTANADATEGPALSLSKDASAASEPETLPTEPSQPAASKPERDMGDPWVDRISALEFVELDRLSELHGKLIAAGFLNFQIRNRQTGVEYRITNAGKQFLARAVEEANEFADSRELNDEGGSGPGEDADRFSQSEQTDAA